MSIVTSYWERNGEYFVIMDDEDGSVLTTEPKVGLRMHLQGYDDNGDRAWKDEFGNDFLEHVNVDVWMGGNSKMITDEATRLSNAYMAEKVKNKELKADIKLLQSQLDHIGAYVDVCLNPH